MTNPLVMSASEREAFLAGVHVGVIAVSRGDGSPPVTGPVWYDYEPGGDVVISLGAASQKAKALRANPTASLCVQQEDLPYKFVTVSGPVELAPVDDEIRRRIATRYLPAEQAEAYLADTNDDSGQMLTARISPRSWFSNDYAKYR
jgi:uncharacterized protein